MNLTRHGLILGAILLTPVWAWSQQPSAARSETILERLQTDRFIEQVGLLIEDSAGETPPTSEWLFHQPVVAGGGITTHLVSEPVLSAPLLFDPAEATSDLDGSSPLPSVLDRDPFEAEPLTDSLTAMSTDADDDPIRGNCPHCGAPPNRSLAHRSAIRYRVCDVCGCDVEGKQGFGPGLAMRFGWWGVSNDGSPVKVGEFQDLSPSPFWDLDGVWSNRVRTLDFTLTGLDNEANHVQGYYFGPGLSAKVRYERFLRRLDHLPLSGFDVNSGTPGPTDKVVSEDLNVGEDYAIRVQQLDTTVKGQLTRDLKWKVNLWGMRKSGERQANAMAHCFNMNTAPAAANYTCHVLSQRQQIDWTTMEITPVLEANLGDAVVEYSRTMRAFGQNDQIVERTYTAFDYSPAFGSEGPPFVYGWVPESFTQIDRLKLNVPLNDCNQLYSHLYFGDTHNDFRDTNRKFNGFDLRLTNRAFHDTTLTAYAKLDTQRRNLPTDYLTAPPFGVNAGPTGTFEPSSLRHPIEYTGGRVGVKGNWQSPSRNWFSIVGGYEFFDLSRDFVTYDSLFGSFTQEDTLSHLINIGPYFRVTSTLDTYIRYKGGFIHNPLIGVGSGDPSLNSNQPEQVHRIELGGTWNPVPNFIATYLFGIENSWHHSQYANFDEDNYPILFTVWYAPWERFSITGGYAFLSNWIDQDVTVGFLNNPTETTQWNYDGYNNVVSLGASYAYTPRTQLVGGFQWDRGSNVFSVPPSIAGADWSLLPTFSDVVVETSRIHVGIDHEFRPSMSTYFRYVHFDFEDFSEDFNSGTTDMFLGGFTLIR